MALACGLLACGSSGSGGNWTCHWNCVTDSTSGTATYPSGTSNPTQQCAADHGTGCSNFNCGCNQN
jgi:hypothetical protein